MAIQPTRILIIEDESAHAEAIIRSLEGLEGAEFRVMGSLWEFREQADSWNPGIALIDLNLPDGRATEVLPDPSDGRPFPMVVMTSYGSEQAAVEALRSGAFDYLVKSPETFRELPRTVERLLREWQFRAEAKRMHLELKESEAKFRSLTESSTDFIMRYDRQGRHTYLNPAALEMLGPQAAGILGKTHLECGFPEELCHFWESRIQQVFQTAQPMRMEFEFESHQGPVIHDWCLTPEFDATGKVYSLLGVSRDITERKRMETALREAYLLNAQVIQCAQEGIIVYGLDLKYLIWNSFMEGLTGKTANEVLGHHPLEVFPFLRDTGVMARLERALAGEAAGFSEFHFDIPSTGKSGWTTQASAPLRNSKNEVIGVIATVSDITAQKGMVDALREGEARYRSILNASPDAITIADLEGRILGVPTVALPLFRSQSEDDFLGHWITDLLVPEDRDRASLDIVHMFDGSVAGLREYRGLRMDGSTFDLEANGEFIRDAEGKPIRIVFVVRDITERKLAEVALRESNELLSLFVLHSPIYAYIKEVTSTQSRVLHASENFQQMIGIPGSAMIGKTMVELFPAEMAAQMIADDWAVVSAGEAMEFPEKLNGRSYLSVKFPIIQRGKTLLAGFTIDITDRQRAEEERARLQTQLLQSQRMESLGSLAGGVAHDMNNVLGAILGMATAHIEAEAPGSPAHRAFDTIIKAAERGGKMVKGLLSFARQSPAETRELDLNALLREEAHLLERTTLFKVRVLLELAPELQSICGDASALTHAFMNLCVNAVDAMPENGTLTLRTRNVDNDWIEVVVEDTGTGMAKEVLEKALDPFFTTKEVGKGTGLGLSMVYRTVAAHHGQMEIESEPFQGTRVRLRFPVYAGAPTAPEPEANPSLETPQVSLQILLVDDDELIQGSVRAILEMLGHQIIVTSCGEEALARLEGGFQPDLVILDMNMPGLGGAGTLPRIRALRPALPVLLATGRVDQFATDLAEAHPFVTLLSKPFSMKDLQQQLRPLAQG